VNECVKIFLQKRAVKTVHLLPAKSYDSSLLCTVFILKACSGIYLLQPALANILLIVIEYIFVRL
jgi:hypothetical protein